MPGNLQPEVVDSVTNTNFKVLNELPIANAISHQKRLDIIAETALTKNLEALHGTDVAEGLGLAAAQRGDLAKQLAELASSIAQAQQVMKGAQTTPPPTA